LDRTEKEHREWKTELAKRRKKEVDDRRKQLEVIPFRQRVAVQKKYETVSAQRQKVAMESKTKFTTMDAHWKTEEQKMKGIQAKEKTLSDEKKSLFTKLATKVKEEYQTGKELKAEREAYDAAAKTRKVNEARLLVKKGKETVFKRELNDATTAVAAFQKSKEEQAGISDKEIGHIRPKLTN